MKIRDVKSKIFPFLGVQSPEWQNKGEEIAQAWSDGYKKAYKEVWEHLNELEEEEAIKHE